MAIWMGWGRGVGDEEEVEEAENGHWMDECMCCV